MKKLSKDQFNNPIVAKQDKVRKKPQRGATNEEIMRSQLKNSEHGNEKPGR